MGRRHGLQAPIGLVPASALAWQVAELALFAALAALAVAPHGGDGGAALLAAWGPCAGLAAACWVACQRMDPAARGGSGCAPALPCAREARGVSRYCGVCKKVVPGLDHHCMWLNTCVGRRTYTYFYLLSLFGAAAGGLQTVSAIFVVAKADVREAAVDTLGAPLFFTLAGLVAASSIIPAGFYASLWLFHNYLLLNGHSTFSYLIERRDRELSRSRAERKRAVELEEKAASQDWAEKDKQWQQGIAMALDTPSSAEDTEEGAAGAAEGDSPADGAHQHQRQHHHHKQHRHSKHKHQRQSSLDRDGEPAAYDDASASSDEGGAEGEHGEGRRRHHHQHHHLHQQQQQPQQHQRRRTRELPQEVVDGVHDEHDDKAQSYHDNDDGDLEAGERKAQHRQRHSSKHKRRSTRTRTGPKRHPPPLSVGPGVYLDELEEVGDGAAPP